MDTAYKEVERLLEQIRAVSHNPVVERCSDQIQVLCSAYMEPDQTNIGLKYGLRGSKAAIFNLLHKRMGQIVTRHALMNVLEHHNDEPETGEAVLRVHLVRVRDVAEENGFEIKNIHSVGYRMTDLSPAQRTN